MHNNYYFLRQISKALRNILKDAVALDCFSQNKNELLIEFNKKDGAFFIRINTSADLCCVSFPEDFRRSRRNSVDLFREIIGRQVENVIQFENDRSFSICFGDLNLAVLLHGNRANVVLFKNEEALGFFNKKLSRGFNSRLSDLQRELEFSYVEFRRQGFDVKRTIPTFDNTVLHFINSLSEGMASPEGKWQTIEFVLKKLESPSYYLIRLNQKPILSLLPTGEILKEFETPIEATNHYFQYITTVHFFQKEKEELIKETESKIVKAKAFLSKAKDRKSFLLRSNEYEQYANILMANINEVPMESKSTQLFNFYTNSIVTIPLKEGLSVQKNAEIYYKKGKNKKLEIQNLEAIIEPKEKLIDQLETRLIQLWSVENFKELKAFKKENDVDIKAGGSEESLPFWKTCYDGYEILVGKNGKSNDELLKNHTYKDDLWFHAKDVPGSHVILKYKSGSRFPSHVIQRAAEIAAFNSKRKTDSHCPVISTPRKFVRKQKGMAAGEVKLERENVIIVTPKGI